MADPERSVESVISNDDLLTEILVRLPLLSLILFKSVSKHWLSLIKGANVRKLDPLSGLFLKILCFPGYYIRYEFVALDIRIPICRSSLLATKFTFGPYGHVAILDSCNGLLFCCCTSSGKFYVYNPSIASMFKLLPEPDNVTRFNNISAGGLKMAFDPTKSPHYKLIFGEPFQEWVQIHTYSSETGNWSLCGHQFPKRSLYNFRDGVYWNDAIYWLNHAGEFFKLDIMNEHPVLTALQTSLTLDQNFHYEYGLFESRGCLLLVDEGDAHSQHITIYEKGNVYSEWSVKYIINLDDIIKPFPERRSTQKLIYCIVLGEREEDSFLVMELDKKVVQYKIVSKTLSTISDLGPDEDFLDEDFMDEDLLDEDILDEDFVDEDLLDEDFVDEDFLDEDFVDEDLADGDLIRCFQFIITSWFNYSAPHVLHFSLIIEHRHCHFHIRSGRRHHSCNF